MHLDGNMIFALLMIIMKWQPRKGDIKRL